MNVKTTKADIIWSYLGYFFAYATNLIIIILVMGKIESQELGLWYTFISVGNVVQILDFGVSGTLVRNITYAWNGVEGLQEEGFSFLDGKRANPNYRLLSEILDASKRICLVIALIVLAVLCSIGTIYILYVSRTMMGYDGLLAWLIYIVAVFLNVCYIFWPTSLMGIGAIKQAQIANTISRFTQIVVSLAGVWMGNGLIGLSLAYLVMGIVLRLLSKAFMYNYYNLGRHIIKNTGREVAVKTREIFKIIWFNAKKQGLVSFSTYLVKQSSTLVCSAFVGLTETAAYGLCLQIVTAFGSVSRIWFQAESPMLISLRVKHDINMIKKKFSLCMVVYWATFVLCVFAFITVGLPILQRIKTNTVIPMAMAVFISVIIFLEYNHSIFCEYIAMSNELPFVRASVVSGVLVSLMALLGGKYIGSIYSILFGRFIVQLLYNNWRWPVYVFKELNITPFSMVKMGVVELKILIKKRLLRV